MGRKAAVRVSDEKAFLWLRNLSDFLVGSLRTARKFDPEDYVKQLADQGFTHVTINGLGTDHPFESGPPGDVYFWFYDYSPDLDQFVESTLIRGFYPKEYLRKNLESLKRTAALARKNGLIPGLHMNSPRSMPEAFWKRYPYLRGARVDHPRESFLPRYTLAMAHPVVQQHYRELVRTILNEVPDIGFIHVWTNDSGAGFEFTSSLYAGRNGGPYLIREWKSDKEIEQKASENVLTYYRLLRDEGRARNPDFRLVCDLGPFYKERPSIVRGLGQGIDAGSFGYFEGPVWRNEERVLRRVGALNHRKIDIADNNIPGIPFPGLVYERLTAALRRGERWMLTATTPRSIAPYDVNGEVLKAVQKDQKARLERILRDAAIRWAGLDRWQALVGFWKLTDRAVRSYPAGIPYSTFGFPWFRLWVRPFVPNIDAISEADRAYYERYLIATFNNPTRVDLNNDMMWNFLTVAEAARKKRIIDTKVLPPLETILRTLGNTAKDGRMESSAVFRDLEVRIKAAHAFYTTMRNVTAWIEGVHGYRKAKSLREKEKYRQVTRDMVEREIGNTRNLLELWRTSTVEFIPISKTGESLHIYGTNFGELLGKKLELMEAHRNDEPFIDPGYMWRMPKQ
ncbi:MAG: hypothetical protein HY563_03350 [Ignavibacteriales bacterium]|nr:hypothetical protein [Ignavibacteriales bacterium]